MKTLCCKQDAPARGLKLNIKLFIVDIASVAAYFFQAASEAEFDVVVWSLGVSSAPW